MTTTHYLHPSAKALTGARLGLGWLDRLEALGITKARVLSTFAFHALASGRRTPTPKAETRLMDEAVKWLETHYAEKVTLAQLVAYMGYSRSRFFNLFREHTGLSPLDWLNRHRIRMAQKLLATGDTTIAEAAHQVGFAELPFFFRLFRRHAGCSPAAYRRQSIASSVASR